MTVGMSSAFQVAVIDFFLLFAVRVVDALGNFQRLTRRRPHRCSDGSTVRNRSLDLALPQKPLATVPHGFAILE
jgi:hypothetical protein